MKLTISLQVTLDGVAQANGGNNEEMDPGFTYSVGGRPEYASAS
ncbi:hypothetical protein AB6813_20290 [bacterium RCC_150]